MKIVRENVPLAGKTSYGIGGPARFYAEPESVEEIAGLYRYARERGTPVFVLGNGSNVLVSDSGVDALVINMQARFAGITWDGVVAAARGGAPLDKLVSASVNRGLMGMEELSGIPGTVGGAVVMNAGAFDTDMARTLRSARVLRAALLTVEDIDADSLSLCYRNSAIKGGGDVLIEASFEFKKEDCAGQALSTRKDILNKRRLKQPLDKPSCGSVFKRPPGSYAGTLIESCGLKGFKIGGATVSDKHANFIINAGGATAQDVYNVIRHVQKIVHEKTGITLEPEVIFVGDFTGRGPVRVEGGGQRPAPCHYRARPCTC